MQFGIRTLDEINVKGKTVLCRVDINQPVDRKTKTLKSIERIKACVPTVQELSKKGAKVVLMAHQGSDIEYKNYYTTEPHSAVLSKLLDKEVKFIPDVCGPAAIEEIKSLKEGEILLLDNVRFMAEEQTLFEEKLNLSQEQQAQTLLVRKLAPLGDIYVCDAFAAAHRNQPSICGFEQILPSAMGRLFEKEYTVLSKLMQETEHPCTFVLGGAKVSDAFLMLDTVLGRGIADQIVTGGVVANIFLIACEYHIGRGSYDFIIKTNYGSYIEKAKEIYGKYKSKIFLPDDLAYVCSGERIEASLKNVPETATITDIGAKTIKKYQQVIRNSKTVFVNGPMGIFEDKLTENGTKEVWEALGDTSAYTVVGGGDSITATTKFGKTNKISYICTGGGALMRFLTGEELPAVKALRHGSRIPIKD